MFKSTRKAFTLVELIVVIVILAILATIAFITLEDYPKDARDSGKATEVGQVITKITAQNAKDPKTYTLNSYMATDPTPVEKAWTKFKLYFGDLDGQKIGGEGFDDMKYIYVTTLAGSEECFEVAAKGENIPAKAPVAENIIYKGNCGKDVKDDLWADLFSKGKTW